MSLRRASTLAGLLLLSCAGQQPAPSPQASPAAGPSASAAPAAGGGGAAASTPAPPPPKPKPTQAQLVATASTAIAADKVALDEAIATSADKKLTSDRFDKARATLARLNAVLAEAQSAEGHDKAYTRTATTTRAQLEKTRTALSVIWLDVGVPVQKGAVDAALRQANQALAAAKQPKATEEQVAKAEAAVKALSPLIERGAPLEVKDAKYAQYATAVKPQLAPLEKGVVDARAALELRTAFAGLQATVEPARKAATEAVTAAGKTPTPEALDAADKAIAALEAALAAGKDVIAQAAKPNGEYAAAVTKEIEARKAAVAGSRAQLAIAGEKGKIEAAEAELDARMGVYKTTPSPDSQAAAEKAANDLDALIKANTELAAKDKAYGARVAQSAKKLLGHRTTLVGLDAEQKIAAHKVELAAARAKMTEVIAGLAGKLEYDAYAEADKAIAAFDKLATAGDPLAAVNAKYAAEIKAAHAEVPQAEMQVRRIWVAATDADAKAKIAALQTKADPAGFDAAEKAVKVMGTTIESSKSSTKQDPKYLAFLAQSEKQVAAYTQQIQARRAGLSTEAFRTRIDAVVNAAAEAMKGVEGESVEPAAFAAAEEAVKKLESETEPDTSLPAADQQYLATQRKKVAEHRARIAKRKVEVLVAAERKKLTEALAALTAKQQALAAGVSDATAAEATKAAAELEEVVNGGAEAGKSDPKFAAELAAAKNKLAPARADIEKRRGDAAVAAHKAKLDAANAALIEKLAAAATKPEAGTFDEANAAAEELESVLGEGKEIKNPQHVALMAAMTKKLTEQQAIITRGKMGLKTAAHRAEVDAAKKKVLEAIEGLAGKLENGPYVAAEKQVQTLAAVMSSGQSIAEEDEKYAAELKARAGEVPALVMQIRKKRIEVAAGLAEERVKGLESAPADGAVSGAESAVEEVAAAIANARSFKTEDKAYAAALAAADKQVALLTARIEKGKSALGIAQHKKTVETAQADVAKKLEALGKTMEYELYNGADAAVTALEKALKSGEALGEKDPAYKKELAAQLAKIEGLRIGIRSKWIEAANNAVLEKMNALTGKPEERAFKAADDAVIQLNRTIEAGRELSKNAPYQASLNAAEKQSAAHRAAIDKRRIDIVVDAHKAELDAAEASLTEKMKTLTDDASFAAASKAVKDLSNVLESGADAASKDPKYGARITALKAKLPGFEAAIAARKIEVEVAAHREKLKASVAAVAEKLGALAKAEDEGAVSGAEAAVSSLESTIADGKSAGEKSPKYAAELAAESKKIADYKGRIAKKKADLEIADHAEELASVRTAVTEAMSAVGEKPGAPSFDAAEAAIAALEAKVGEGKEIGKGNPQHAQRQTQAAADVPKQRAALAKARAAVDIAAHRKAVGEDEAKVVDQIGKLGKSLEYELYNDASLAVGRLEKTIAGGEALGEKDPAYGKELKAWPAKTDAYHIAIRTKWIEAAQAVADEKLGALAGKADEKAFKGAEDAVAVVAKTVESGKTVSKSPAFAKQLAAYEKQVAAQKAQIEKRRVQLVVEAHAAELTAAEAKLAEKLGALGPQADDTSYRAAEGAVDDLVNVLDNGADAGAKDPAYAKRMAALRAKAPGYKTQIANKRVEAEVGGHKQKLKEATADVAEKLAAIAKGTEEAAFGAAEQSISALETTISGGKSAGEKSAAYKKELDAEQKKLAGYRARIVARKGEIELAKHVAELDEAQSDANEAVKGLGGAPDKAAFEAAEEAVGSLEEAIEEGEGLVKAHPAHGKRIAAAKADLPRKKAAIAAAKIGVEVAEAKKGLESAAAEADNRVAQLSESVSPSSIKVAEGAVSTLESAVKGGAELAKKSPAYAKTLAVYPKKVAELRAGIARQAIRKELEAHQRELQEAEAAVAEAIAKLGKSLQYELYNDASGAVAKLDKVIASGEALGEKDPAYGKQLKALAAKTDGYNISIRIKWIEAANQAASEKMAAIAKGDEAAFSAAGEAVDVLERTIESGRELSKNPAFQKALSGWMGKVAAHRAAMAKRKVQLAVDAHKAELDEAEVDVTEKLAALNKEPDDQAVKAASSAVEELNNTLDGATEAAAKDPAYAKRIAATRGKIKLYKAAIEKGRFDADVRGPRERITKALATVEEKLSALGSSSEAAAFSAAEDAVGDLESALADGKGFANENKKFAGELAVQQKKVPAFRARIAKKKVEIELAAHTKELDEAVGEMDEAMGALKGATDEAAYKSAEEAIEGVEEAVGEGAKFAKVNPAHGRKLAGIKAGLGKKRAMIASAKVAAEVAASKKAVESAASEAETRVDQLAQSISPSSVKAAEGAVNGLVSAVDSAKAVAKKNPAYAKTLAGYAKKVAELRLGIKRREVETELKDHRQEMAEAEEGVSEKMAGLGKSLEYELYNGAEQAVNKLDKVIEEGAPLAERDDRYAKELKLARAKIDGYRIAVRTKWIEAAKAQVEDKMAALESKADERALKSAEDAIGVMERTVESGKEVSKAKPYQAKLALAAKQAAGYGRAIEKLRAKAEFGEVRGELDEAATAEAAAVKAAEKDPEAAAEATKAMSALADAIDANEGAAAKDPAHKKRLALLRKKLATDRAKIARLEKAADGKREMAGVQEAEAELTHAMAALAKKKDGTSADAVEEAAGNVEEVIAARADSSDPEAKKYFAGMKKKVALARAAVVRVRGEAGVSEHRAQVETQLASAKSAMASLVKISDRDAVSAASTSVDALMDLVSSGQPLAKANKKYGVYLAGVKKTALKYQVTIDKKKKVEDEAPAARGGSADEEEEDSGEDPVAKLTGAMATLKSSVLAAMKSANEDTVSAAKVALDDLVSTVDASKAAAKKSKPLAKKMPAAKAQIARSKAIVAKLEAKVAKAAKAAEARAAKEAAASSSSGSDAPAGDADEDPRKTVAAAWANFMRQTKALKPPKQPTVEAVDAALDAASEVDVALEEGARSSLASSPKYKKLAATIKKKLKVERAKLLKKKAALEKKAKSA